MGAFTYVRLDGVLLFFPGNCPLALRMYDYCYRDFWSPDVLYF